MFDAILVPYIVPRTIGINDTSWPSVFIFICNTFTVILFLSVHVSCPIIIPVGMSRRGMIAVSATAEHVIHVSGAVAIGADSLCQLTKIIIAEAGRRAKRIDDGGALPPNIIEHLSSMSVLV